MNSQTSPKKIFEIFLDNIKKFIQGIQNKLVQDMVADMIIQKSEPLRRYSHDDLILLPQASSASYDFYSNGLCSLDSGELYESMRQNSIFKMRQEMSVNRYKLQSYIVKKDEYQRVFEMLLRYYTRLRECTPDLEEVWVFLME